MANKVKKEAERSTFIPISFPKKLKNHKKKQKKTKKNKKKQKKNKKKEEVSFFISRGCSLQPKGGRPKRGCWDNEERTKEFLFLFYFLKFMLEGFEEKKKFFFFLSFCLFFFFFFFFFFFLFLPFVL